MQFHDGRVVLHIGDCFDVLDTLPENSIDAVVTDPPYHLTSIVARFGETMREDETKTSERARAGSDGYARLSRGFMGKVWDGGDIAFNPELWVKVFRVLKPGGHMVAFGGTRTYHRLACAIEDAGFEIRDMLAWVYGSGFPKSHDISKAIDRSKGVEREVVNFKKVAVDQWTDEGRRRHALGESNYKVGITIPATDEAKTWEGWGTALKPAQEPICFARKPLSEPTIAANVLKWGTGALNIDGCRIGTEEDISNHSRGNESSKSKGIYGDSAVQETHKTEGQTLGRWPANTLTDGSDEVLALFPDSEGAQGIVRGTEKSNTGQNGIYGHFERVASPPLRNDSGSAARFYYTAKAGELDRIGSKHPTVKPVSLMRWLVRLITPPNGTVLDMFAGTGTTGQAAMLEGFKSVLIEREVEYVEDIERRMKLVFEKTPLKREKTSTDGASLF